MLLSYRRFFVRERVAMLKLTDTYDIFDPATNAQIGVAKEEPPTWAKFARLMVNKRFLPTKIHIYEDDWFYKKTIIKSRILNLLNKSEKIYARKCEIKEIDSKLCKKFLNDNHIQN